MGKKKLLLFKRPVGWRINGVKWGNYRAFGPNRTEPFVPPEIPANALLETGTGQPLLETGTGEFLTES